MFVCVLDCWYILAYINTSMIDYETVVVGYYIL